MSAPLATQALEARPAGRRNCLHNRRQHCTQQRHREGVKRCRASNVGRHLHCERGLEAWEGQPLDRAQPTRQPPTLLGDVAKELLRAWPTPLVLGGKVEAQATA